MRSPDENAVYEFDGFRLDVGGHRLSSADGEQIALSPRVFDTLLCLVEHRGELVSKATLMQAVWPDTVVEENNLNQAITALRKALGESPGDHRFIVTEAGRGYRFVASVTVGEAEPGVAVPATRSGKWWLIASAMIATVVVVLAICYARWWAPSPDSDVLPHSVAVLPFENLSPDPDDAYFAAGIHDEIINRLAGISNLNVIARTSVMQYAGTTRPITDIARDLRVEAVMEGSVRYADQKVRITAHLIDSGTGTELWSDVYSRDLRNIFEIQSDIANAIATSLQAELLPSESGRLDNPPTDSPAAYALFLRGGSELRSGNIEHAIELLDRAAEIDPDFALAYAYKGVIRANQIVNGPIAMTSNPKELAEYEARAIADTNRAMALDEDLASAWLARAVIYQLNWRWHEAGEAFVRAYALGPNDPWVARSYATFLAMSGEREDAVQLARRQIEVDPNEFWPHYILALVIAYSSASMSDRKEVLRWSDEAYAALQDADKLSPGNPGIIALMGYNRLAVGDRLSAESYLETAEQLLSDEAGQYMPAMIYVYGLLGEEQRARRLFDRFTAWSRDHRSGDGEWAFAYLGLRDADTAFEHLARAVERAERHTPDAGFYAVVAMKSNGFQDGILDEPRFRQLRDRLGAITRLE